MNMKLIVHVLVAWGATLLTIVSGLNAHIERSSPHRQPREIRKSTRAGRLLYQHTSEESELDTKKGLLFNSNRPSEPLHDLYRKGFSHFNVPDFHRQAVEERSPGGGNNQSIDDIISGIIHLLGGDVQVARPGTRVPSGFTHSSPKPTRINNRGPAGFDQYTRNRTSVTPAGVTTDVSKILGLYNDTTTTTTVSSSNSTIFNDSSPFIGGINDISSGSLEVVQIIPSSESTASTTETNMIDRPEIKPTGVLTELGTDGHTMLETVVSSAPDQTTRTVINHSEPPLILPSTDTIFTSTTSGQPHHSIPSGPVTEWLPIAKPPERRPNYTTPDRNENEEPVIITRPPDSFEITITHQMYSTSNESQPTSTTTTTQPTSVTTAIPTFTSLIPPSDVTSTTDISVSIGPTTVDVIYGRPSATPRPPPPVTGRPQVYPVDIEKVRPSTRPSVYQRPPRPHDVAINKYGSLPRPPPPPLPPRPQPGAAVPMVRKPPSFRPPPQLPQLPEIRIDTCVVGDDSTCDVQMKEQCRTERGVSSCLCRPGYGRTVDRTPCTPVVSMLLTLKVAKLGEKNIDPSHFVPGSPEYQRLNFEASHGVSTLFGLSPLSDAYRGASVNRVYFIAQRMVINATVHLAEAGVRGSLRHHVEHAVAAALNRADSRLGTSRLYVNGPLAALVEVEDLNECGDNGMNDCSEFAVCENLFGSFQCKCKPGYTDKSEGDGKNTGRICTACSPDYCNGKGQCVVVQGRQECRCRGNYGGSRCQIDNEVVGVSVGVSVIAIIVIAITAGCLYLWNRRWKKAHQKSEAAKQHAGYRLQTMADHVRWGPSPLGSTYVPSESTMHLASAPGLSASTGQLYAISTLQAPLPPRPRSTNHYQDDINPYGRIIRTLQKRNSLTHSGGLQYDTLNSECPSSEELGFPSVPSNSFVYHGTFPERGNLYR